MFLFNFLKKTGGPSVKKAAILFLPQKIIVITQNIVDDFKLHSKTGITAELANYLFKALLNKKSEKTSMLFQEWEVLFHLSETDK